MSRSWSFGFPAVRLSGRRRPGATLVEMLIALVILALMLFSIMAVMMVSTRNAVAAKEAMGASLASLSELEKMEAKKVSDDVTDTALSGTGAYTLDRELTPGDLGAADITIRVERGGVGVTDGFGPKTLKRQVSPSAWQNAGELP